MSALLRRETFKTSRLAEFCSTRELVNQTGHAIQEWPLVILKETVDNAIDAAEETGIAPVVEIIVGKDGITISDNGPGMKPETIAAMLDFNSRVSSREAYASPTRGAQGNALKTIVAMAYALDGSRGETIIESHGIRHIIAFAVDPIRQEPKIDHTQKPSLVTTGVRLTVRWPDCARSILDAVADRFLQITTAYGWINPHLHLSIDWRRATTYTATFPPTHPTWLKWSPADPTSPHWYDAERLGRLIGAKIAHAEDNDRPCPTVREFIAEFRGLAGTAKGRDICDAVGASRQSLAEFYAEGQGYVAKLLDAMKSHSRAVKPKDIGVIGRDHVEALLIDQGGEPESFAYKLDAIELDGVPYVIECAFAYCSDVDTRTKITGLNWSVSIGADPFRSIGFGGLDALLQEQRASCNEPVIFFLHLASPRLQFTDRGKSAISLPWEVDDTIVRTVNFVTKRWAKQRRAEERSAAAFERRYDALARVKTVDIKEAAARILVEAYMKASSNNTLPANARQVYYAARPLILAQTGKDTLDSKYFCQTVLVDYIEENNLDWDIVWDDRGHFLEPHTGKVIGLGTLSVRDYIHAMDHAKLIEACVVGAEVKTRGPNGRYAAILFVEKEGFLPLLEKVKLPERFDIAIMSSKGMSVTAARMLADNVCAQYQIPLLTLHDFDRSGFSIGKTVSTSNRRYTFENTIEVINLGLRLEDVEQLGLEFEPAPLGKTDPDAARERLRINGATEDEIAILVDQELRCELNAMTSEQFVNFVEGKLDEFGVQKVVPDDNEIAVAYRLFRRGEKILRTVKRVIEEYQVEDVDVPADLTDRLREYPQDHPHISWDDALAQLSEEDDQITS
jgi:DNA topoisomerase VI subunit B